MTAVEWLQEIYDSCNNYEKFIANIDWEQAKEMEKEQMRDAGCPYIGGWEDDEFEYWYNETFKNTKQ